MGGRFPQAPFPPGHPWNFWRLVGDSSSMTVFSATSRNKYLLIAWGCRWTSWLSFLLHFPRGRGPGKEHQEHGEAAGAEQAGTGAGPADPWMCSALAKPCSADLFQRSKLERFSLGDLATEKLLFCEF